MLDFSRGAGARGGAQEPGTHASHLASPSLTVCLRLRLLLMRRGFAPAAWTHLSQRAPPYSALQRRRQGLHESKWLTSPPKLHSDHSAFFAECFKNPFLPLALIRLLVEVHRILLQGDLAISINYLNTLPLMKQLVF